MARHCSSCGVYRTSSSFSRNQWAKGNGVSRCVTCVGQHQPQPVYHTTGYASHAVPAVDVPIYHLRTGYAVVVPTPPPSHQCNECHRQFNSQNELNMHMQVHRPRQFHCPVCGDVRFKSPANAVQHIESGYCRGCLGQDNARQQIYNHVQRYAGGGSNPLLTNGGSQPSGGGGSVPDFPYHCQQCTMKFRNLSQLMQHMDQKHSQMRMLGY